LKRIVVDASVVVKWLLPEIHSEAAKRLLADELQLWAPDLVWSEVGNVLWKRWRRGELPADVVQALLRDFRRFPLSVHPSDLLLQAAWEVAHALDRSFYDSLYLALAAALDCPLVTADRKLWNALQDGLTRASLLWVEEIS
jgi:predicted nucleic acid-binding protein